MQCHRTSSYCALCLRVFVQFCCVFLQHWSLSVVMYWQILVSAWTRTLLQIGPKYPTWDCETTGRSRGYCREQQAKLTVEGEKTKAGVQSWLSHPAEETTTQTSAFIHLPHQRQIPHKQNGRATVRDLLQLLCLEALRTDCNWGLAPSTNPWCFSGATRPDFTPLSVLSVQPFYLPRKLTVAILTIVYPTPHFTIAFSFFRL